MRAYIPSPSRGVFHLGPFPIRVYALCIILGVLAAATIGDRRWVARGGRKGTVWDVAGIAVPSGLIGARIYHVVTSPAAYFGKGGHLVDVLYIWHGGIGIPGGIAGGFLGGYLVCRRRGIRAGAFADAIAPGVAVGQAIGRFGNYFNQELFGRPTHLPWGLTVNPDNPDAVAGAQAYHPTFLYESLWDLGVAGLVVWADRRWRLGRGRAFALYLAAYTTGRLWIEALRIDHAATLFGIRLNDYVSALVLIASLTYLVARRGQPREEVVQQPHESLDVPSTP
ncbi:MAG: prolipoprotein diacylglyceryl transferase [Actinomycetota bacterium]|nr:prolipoprotein diacylglyceryl transferase [Actinomycetota bacterium]